MPDGSSNKYFIQEHLHREVFHGGIGNIDAEKIFLKKGYTAIQFPCRDSFSLWAKLRRAIYLVKSYASVKADAVIVFQFPLYAGMHKLLIRLLKRWKKAPVICFITDIDGIKDGDPVKLEKEKKSLQGFSDFIVHNREMKKWLQQVVPGSRIQEIEFFDFLTTPVSVQRTKSNTIVFAGNLGKSSFLEKLDTLQANAPSLHFMLYGTGVSEKTTAAANVTYKGVHDPHHLASYLEGSFGLVWDGDGIEDCSGPLGEYMQYISHNKLSLYIVAGLPVITAKKAASAYLIEKYRIGVTVNSLVEIPAAINSIDEETYQTMINNTKALALKITQGECLGNALDILEKEINSRAGN